MTALTRLSPIAMALYSAIHTDRELADVAGQAVAGAWSTTIAIIPATDPGSGWRLFDLGADLDADVVRRAVAIFNPDVHQQRGGRITVND